MKNTFVFDKQLAEVDMEHAWDYVGKKQDLTLPILPPPKRFLKMGSKYSPYDHIRYFFFQEGRKIPFSSEVHVSKYHNIESKKLRLLRLSYFFIRDKNSMSENKKGFRSIVYNTETKALYLLRPLSSENITKKGITSKRLSWTKSVIRLSLNNSMLDIELYHFYRRHIDKFITDLHQIISMDIPGIRLECDKQANKIVALILQHRVGKVIPGLNDTCIDNLGYMSKLEFIDRRVEAMEEHLDTSFDLDKRNKDVRKLKRNSSYKFIPVLAETGSLKKAIQVLLGECYVGIFSKLMFDIDFRSISAGQVDSIIKYKKNMPKSIQNYISWSLGKLSSDEFRELFREAMNLSRTTVDTYIKDNWIKTVRRMETTIPWQPWVDTYRMAVQLGLRIRPNTFMNVQDIWDTHDRLSRLIRRHNRISNNINIGVNDRFIEIKYPKKFKGYTFRQLMTPAELSAEGNIMEHCVHTYKNTCAKGTSVIFSVKNPAGTRYTAEYNPIEFSFLQAEGAKSDNNGERNICSNQLKDSIFIPFAPVLKRYNQNGNYQALSLLNITIIDTFNVIKLIENVLDTPDDKYTTLTALEADLCRRNELLEKLIDFRHTFKEHKNPMYEIEKLAIEYGLDDKHPLQVGAQVGTPVPVNDDDIPF